MDTIRTIQDLSTSNGSARHVTVALTPSDIRLIAAAPDLLEVLQRLCELNAADRPVAKTWARAEAAIAKATGTS